MRSAIRGKSIMLLLSAAAFGMGAILLNSAQNETDYIVGIAVAVCGVACIVSGVIILVILFYGKKLVASGRF